MGCLQLLDYLSDSRSNSSWNDKLLILRMLKVQHCKSDTWVMCCPHFHWMCFFIIFEARKLTHQGFQASFRQFLRPCLHSKWMSWKHVERWQRCLAANKPVLKTFRNRSALPKVIEGLSNKWPMDGMSFWHMLAFQLVRTLWIRCISSTFIHIWHIFISPTIIIANTSQIKSCSNLSPKKTIKTKWPTGRRWRLKWEPQQESKQNGATVDSRLTASSNKPSTFAQRKRSMENHIKSFVITWCIYIRIYVCLFLWWCSYAHLVRDLFRVYFMYLHVPQGLVFVAPSLNLAGFYLTSFFDFWSVLTFQMSFGRFDVSFLLEFRDVSVAKLKN